MTSNAPGALDAHDPEVERAMKVIGQLSPTERDEFLRTTYRYVYAYRRTRDPNLLTELANCMIGAVPLHANPDYAHAVEELHELKKTATGEPVDVREMLASERARRAG
jgi:hypothetical protein